MNKTLPKSLHTVTALVNVARHLRTLHPEWDAARAVAWAVDILGYGHAPDVDPYGLRDKAIAILARGGR